MQGAGCDEGHQRSAKGFGDCTADVLPAGWCSVFDSPSPFRPFAQVHCGPSGRLPLIVPYLPPSVDRGEVRKQDPNRHNGELSEPLPPQLGRADNNRRIPAASQFIPLEPMRFQCLSRPRIPKITSREKSRAQEWKIGGGVEGLGSIRTEGSIPILLLPKLSQCESCPEIVVCCQMARSAEAQQAGGTASRTSTAFFLRADWSGRERGTT
jgi:hypothetical protein